MCTACMAHGPIHLASGDVVALAHLQGVVGALEQQAQVPAHEFQASKCIKRGPLGPHQMQQSWR